MVRRPDRHARRQARTAWLLVSPLLMVLLLVALWPLARTIWFSFTDASLLDLGAAGFVGFDNFARLAVDPDWWRSVGNTLFFTLVSVTLEVCFGFAIALTLHARFRGRGLVRAAMLVPWAIPTVVSAKMWAWMFHDVYGVVNEVLLRLGLIAAPIAWTASPDLSMAVLIVVDVWKTTPFVALLLLAGLQLLPEDCYEAARVDGVPPVAQFFWITLPLMKPALAIAATFRALDALRIFDLVYVLTAGSRETMSMAVYARQQLIDFQDFGMGSAAATLLVLIVAMVTVIYVMVVGLQVSGRSALAG